MGVAGAVAAGLGADPARAPVPPGDEGGHRVGDRGVVAQAGGQDQGVLEGQGRPPEGRDVAPPFEPRPVGLEREPQSFVVQ